ncbi:MAG: acyltransferase [Archangium sp.]|nr:acyltransferase [Archangium sp.]
MFGALGNAWKKLSRDLKAGKSPVEVAAKSARYAAELASAKVFLRGVQEVGEGVRTLERPRIDNQGFLSIGAHTLLRSVNVPVELATSAGARLSIGADCSINYGVSIGCTESIRVGARCRLGPYVMIVDTAFHELLDRSKRPPSQPVVIEDDVWIGAKASIMPGVRIGRGSVVGTAAVVTKDVPPFSVVAGVPAKVVKTLDASKFVASRPGD